MAKDVDVGAVGMKRTLEMAAIFMIGDGVLGLLQPRRHVGLWRSRFEGVDALVRPFADREAVGKSGSVGPVSGCFARRSAINN